jgi:hypothetical protein
VGEQDRIERDLDAALHLQTAVLGARLLDWPWP